MTDALERTSLNGIPIYRFPLFNQFSDLRHGVFTRHGGCSDSPFQSLNTSLNIGDDQTRVERNRAKIAACLRTDPKDLVFARQEHGARVLVHAGDRRGDAPERISSSGIGDALVTDIRGRYLVIQVADCQSVVIYDPHRKVVANIHSGWRGSVLNIIGETVDAMTRQFNCVPSDMVAGISPSLGPCCAEFINYRTEIPKTYWRYKEDDRRYFDFWSLSRVQLRDKGVLAENIAVSRICTRCRTDMFFSYRGEGETGRFASVIGMKASTGRKSEQ
jgi:YfiH family protein